MRRSRIVWNDRDKIPAKLLRIKGSHQGSGLIYLIRKAFIFTCFNYTLYVISPGNISKEPALLGAKHDMPFLIEDHKAIIALRLILLKINKAVRGQIDNNGASNFVGFQIFIVIENRVYVLIRLRRPLY
ncbi:hypothetical protein D3C78_925870 [compost metagenome]